MPTRRRTRKSKFVTKRGLPFLLTKYSEAKQLNFTYTDLAVPEPAIALSNVIDLTEISQGDSRSERIGNMIQVTGLYVSYTIESSDISNPQFFRLIVYSPRKVDTTLLPADNMVKVPDSDKFKIWYDKTSPPAFQAGGGSGVFKVRKRWKPYMKVIYDSSSQTSVTQGQIKLMVLSDVDLGVTVNLHARIYFRDL